MKTAILVFSTYCVVLEFLPLEPEPDTSAPLLVLRRRRIRRPLYEINPILTNYPRNFGAIGADRDVRHQ
jgi:hypothetical protein